jgi:hypothetical protein
LDFRRKGQTLMALFKQSVRIHLGRLSPVPNIPPQSERGWCRTAS